MTTAPPVVSRSNEQAAAAVRLIALAGNPNCGKTTLFNALTGLRQKVANYAGVTVEKKTGLFRGQHGEPMQIVDLPGSYSLHSTSPDETIAHEVLCGSRSDIRRPDVILSVVDATNLERNLYFTTQLLELGIPVVIALNMMDAAEQQGIRIDTAALGQQLGVPVIPIAASTGFGITRLKTELSQRLHPPRIQPGAATSHKRDAAATEARYRWIQDVCARTVHRAGNAADTISDHLDGILTHRIWGWLGFITIMALIFYAIFAIASWPMDWIELGVSVAGQWLADHLPAGDLRSLLVDGVVAGVGGVVVFLPQILILFFFLGILEDSGYMARATFIMDRVMARVGLHGKSFIPLLSSFACAIPGIMATRTIENRKDRLATILVAPLMSCSARLPVYALMIALLVPGEDASPWTKAGIMFAMYLLGTSAAFVLAGIFKRSFLRSEKPMLLLEMPPYRLPSPRSIALRIWERASLFLRQAGTVILALSIVLWALVTFPKSENSSPSESLTHSAAGWLGHALEPAIKPLGFDWKMGIGLISSFAARESFVGTMAVVYHSGQSDDENATLRQSLAAQRRPGGTPVYTPLTCVSLMVFYVFAMQCMSTLAVVRRETSSWRWPAFQFLYMAVLAYGASLIVFQGGRLLGFQ